MLDDVPNVGYLALEDEDENIFGPKTHFPEEMPPSGESGSRRGGGDSNPVRQ